MILFHGTTLEKYEQMKEIGLRAPYLSNSIELAWSYAEAADGETPIVLEVEVDTNNLLPDYRSLAEPCGYEDRNSKDIEDEISKFNGEMTWETSLMLTGACKSNINIHKFMPLSIPNPKTKNIDKTHINVNLYR